MKLIAQGAEAKLYQDKTIVKDRVKKSYRHPKIDESLRKARTKREAKILQKLEKLNFPSPKLIKQHEYKLEMELIKGKRLSDHLEKLNYKSICKEIGKLTKNLHSHHIIHGDLTTSNMIYNTKVYFIDFGLSYTSQRIEDKAVDLHLIKQALESKHHTIYESCFKEILKAYKDKEIIQRLEKVEARGRYKGKSAQPQHQQ